MTREVKILTTEDIQSVVAICSNYGFDIGIHSKSGIADAKSLLGMFMLSLNEEKHIVVEDDIDASALWKDLADYLLPL